MGKTVDWYCNTSEMKRDDLILDLHTLLSQAIAALPGDDEVVIRWRPEDLCEAAREMGLRLSQKQARDLLGRIRLALEDKSLSAGQDLINERLEEIQEAAASCA